MKHYNLLMTAYTRIGNLLDILLYEVESEYYSSKNKCFKFSGNIGDCIISVHCIETILHKLYLVFYMADIDMEFDLYDSDDLEKCIEDIMSVIR